MLTIDDAYKKVLAKHREDLTEITKKLVNVDKHTGFNEFYSAYRGVLSRVRDSHTETLQLAIDYLPVYWDACSNIDSQEAMSSCSVLTRALLVKEHMDYAKTVQHTECAIAWMILYYSAGYHVLKLDNDKQNLRILISSWTNIDLDGSFEPSIDNVVKLFYGTVCWDLYGVSSLHGQDAALLIPVVNQIVSANLPFAFKQNDIHGAAASLPESLDI